MRRSTRLAATVTVWTSLACGGPSELPASTAAPARTVASIEAAFDTEGPSYEADFADRSARLRRLLGEPTRNEYGVDYWKAQEGAECRILWLAPGPDARVGTWALERHGCEDNP